MSYKKGDEIHIEDDEATGASKEGVVRWVLGISLLAAIAFLSFIWIFGALSQGDVEEEITMSGNRDSVDGESSIDPVLTDSDNDPADLDAADDEMQDGLDIIENE
ncbi:hypothetical protein [Aurantiacibacter aquimixticola]|uniref:Uncharacterized protein n=1 Tax=Aurantiacibacter aquimixticola TaxID=1958945 RepID=A0A419RVZ6_9SPHN|nr:hypothetical protein [Aurantiacibacter aquimixticola]RJY09962.1 hypothetical protein D6201_11930 [Aurantiacibacter aquimixticola]